MKTVPKPCVCSSIRKAARIMTRAYDYALSEADINGTQLSIMRAIERNPGESMAQVAAELAMDRSTFYRSLAPLKKKGWIKIKNKKSGPAKTVRVTSGGKAVLKNSAPLWDELQTTIIDRFGRVQWTFLVSELKRLEDCIPYNEGEK